MKFHTARSTFNRQGFALIATISVMVLLVMIALAMLSLSTIEMRQASRSSYQQEAQANARMALMIAIGQLQKYAGPDTRVTANASVANASSPNPYWVGVYKTRPDEDLMAETPISGKFVADHHESPLYLTDVRNGKKLAPETYLVSGQDPKNLVSSNLAQDSESVLLLNAGSASDDVRVKLDSAPNGGRLGYWVSDNSVKALMNQSSPYESGSNRASASKEEFYASCIVQSPYLDSLKVGSTEVFAGHSKKTAEMLEKIVSQKTARLSFSALTPAKQKFAFHNVCSENAGVFSDPMRGGLQRDLTPFIETGDMTPSGDDSKGNMEDLALTTPIIRGKAHEKTSPQFGILKNWADMRFKISGSGSSAKIETQVSPDSKMLQYQKFNDKQYSPNLKSRDLTQVKTNYIQPIVVEASMGWDFSPYSGGNGDELLRAHVFPRLVLWNPYNVALKARKYVMLINISTSTTLNVRSNKKEDRIKRNTYELLCKSKSSSKTEKVYPGFVTEPISLEPGECKILVPQHSTGYGQPFDPVNISSNVLVEKGSDVGPFNFYCDTGKKLPAEDPDKPYHYYGYSGEGYYCFWGGQNDQFVVLQASDGVGNFSFSDLESDKFESIANFVACTACEHSYSKWLKPGEVTSVPDPSGNVGFLDMNSWGRERKPPRAWRFGVRMLRWDESEELAAQSIYSRNECILDAPLLSTVNLHGGTINHASALSVQLQTTKSGDTWQVPYLNGYTAFWQPTDPADFDNYVPPSPLGGSGPERLILFDVPRRESGIFSLGQFQSAQFSYLSWHPTWILGSGYSTYQSDLDASALRDRSKQSSSSSPFLVSDSRRWSNKSGWSPNKYRADSIIQKSEIGDEVLVYDISYELNHSIWDHYMLSGIPYTGGEGSRKFSWDGKEELPVSYYTPIYSGGKSIDDFVSKSASNSSYPFYHSAEYLMRKGVLNINCDNKEIWKAFLLGLQGEKHPNLDSSSGNGDVNFSRNILPGGAGKTKISNAESDEDAWTSFRSLSEREIDDLATKIVEEVKNRGPFLSVSDFINRRLSNNDDENRSGALQAAIDATSINSNLNTTVDTTAETLGTLMTYRTPNKETDIPGYFSQNDILTAIAPLISARGDTFTIRAYGEARNKKGDKVLARAYCEAIVQRIPDYVDPSDNAAEPVRIYNSSTNTWEFNTDLSPVNIKFGRKFIIKSFRWLNSNEI